MGGEGVSVQAGRQAGRQAYSGTQARGSGAEGERVLE
jgi:hypothetical protein